MSCITPLTRRTYALPLYKPRRGCVQRLLSLEIIKDKLQRHEYRSISQLSKDFYELLNNGRTVTSPDTLTWSDSLLLAELYEDLRERSLKVLPDRTSYSSGLDDVGDTSGVGIRVYRDDLLTSTSSSSTSSSSSSTLAASYPSDACPMMCGFCNIPHRVAGWPSLAITAAATQTVQTTSDKRNRNRNESKTVKSKAVEKSRQNNNAKRKKTDEYVLTSEDEKLPFSWALNQMLKSCNTGFTRSEGPNLMRVPLDRREATEKKWAAEWEKAAAFLKKKENEREKEKRREKEIDSKSESSSDLDNSSLSDGESSETSFRWICPSCIHSSATPRESNLPPKVPCPSPSFLLNRVVKVWWLDDEMYYRGTVNAFDEAAGEHCCSVRAWLLLTLAIRRV
jgi:Bromodomain